MFSGLMPSSLVEQHTWLSVASSESACRFIILSRFFLLISKASPKRGLTHAQAHGYAQINIVDKYLHTLPAYPSLLLPVQEQIGKYCSFILCAASSRAKMAQGTMDPTCAVL